MIARTEGREGGTRHEMKSCRVILETERCELVDDNVFVDVRSPPTNVR